jgi:ATP-dependent DNA helicase RecQ
MPTGSGKSICFQLPALLFSGLTVVVSPLISLMEDQVLQLRELGVPAAFLNSTLNYDAYLGIAQNIRSGRIKLVYAAPETLLRPETLVLLEDCQVDCLTIDEAHCISEWGHDFRPEYRQLLDLRHRIPDAVCLAVTATATRRVREDIKATMAIPDADEFVAGFDRDNLFLAAEPRVDGLAQTLAFLEAHRGESGIIYCWTRETVDQLAADLLANGWAVRPYHAGLDNKTRLENQRSFAHDRVPIIVATIAFGMGINKSNVRFVLHYDLPKDLESYYQQIGRAGRDGLPADCLLLFSRAEIVTARHFIDQQPPAQRIGSEMRLQAMLSFAETSDCRRRPLLTYFGDSPDQENCGLCDNCLAVKDTSNLVDLTEPAQKFLSCVKRTGEVFGVNHITDILRGSRSQKVLSRGHEQLSTYGIGREFSADDWHSLARQFVQKGLLVQDTEHGSLKLTSQGWAVLRGEKFMGTMPGKHRVALRPVGDVAYDAELFERLRAKRRELADEAGVPPYVVFHDSSLRDMATYYPQSLSSFATMVGVGEQKAEKYGTEFLAVISAYCQEYGLQEIEKAVPTRIQHREPVRSGHRRMDEVVEAFNNGLSIDDIADQSGVKKETIIKHLWEAAQNGALISADELIAQSQLNHADQTRVMEAFNEFGLQRLKPIYEALDGSIGYDEIHLIRLYLFLIDKNRNSNPTPHP